MTSTSVERRSMGVCLKTYDLKPRTVVYIARRRTRGTRARENTTVTQFSTRCVHVCVYAQRSVAKNSSSRTASATDGAPRRASTCVVVVHDDRVIATL